MKHVFGTKLERLLVGLGILIVITLAACGDSDQPDPCADVTCEVGVCDPDTASCVDPEQCEVDDDCTEEMFCGDDGACESADEICESVDCERGVCDAASRACVNADGCDGDDTRCVDGYFCDDSDQCREDPCAEAQCPDGVCDPATGECISDDACQVSDDCPANHLCVDQACRHVTTACGEANGDGGCPGNQSCEYDADELTAECAEPVICETSLDCAGDRQCGGQDCMAPVDCDEDFFEPNNSRANATAFAEATADRSLSASACADDLDVYRFDTTEMGDQGRRATLIVDVDVAHRDAGLGEVEVRLIGPEGDQRDAGTTGDLGARHNVRLSASIGLIDHGEYLVEVDGGDDMSDAGVHYDLSIDLVPEETVEACESVSIAPIPIEINQRLSGTTQESSSTIMGSSCTSETNSAAEVIYAIELDRPKEVRLELSPAMEQSDLSMSIRGSCIHRASEEACVDQTVEGTDETLTTLLDSGVHYVVVQAAQGGVGGGFQLEVEAINTLCSPAENHCADADTAMLCAADGGRYISQRCDAGCDPTTGRCAPPAGDVCLDAPGIDADTSMGFDLLELSDDYQLGGSACVGDAARTRGPDQTYRIDLPAHTAVTARAWFDNNVEGSLYVTDECPGVVESCLDGATDSTDDVGEEVLTHPNPTDQDRTVYLVVDTAADQPFSGGQLEVSFDEVICEPGAGRCSPDDDELAEVCNAHGTEFVAAEPCHGWGCADGACRTPNTCANALDVTTEAGQTDGVSYSIGWDAFTDEEAREVCGMTETEIVGPDAMFTVELSDGEVLHASLDPGGGQADPAVIITGDCAAPDNACYVSDRVSEGAADATYRAAGDERVYVITNSNNQGSRADSQLHLEVVDSACDPAAETPSCTPGGQELEYCGPNGSWQTYACSGGCQDDACVDRTAEVCLDAPDVTAEARQADGFSVTADWADFTNDYQHYPSCGVDPDRSVGEDAVYAVQLEAGESVTAALEVPETPWATLAIVTDCPGVTRSCVAGDTPTGSNANASYTATADETVYVVAEHDWSSADVFGFTLDIEVQ